MALMRQQIIIDVENTLRNSLRKKMESYRPEPAIMPFHTRLLGKNRMALFSFIHSLNTNFGITIFEPVAKSLALSKFKSALTQQFTGTLISENAQRIIQDIIDGLTAANRQPCKIKEIEAIKEVCQTGLMKTIKPTLADLWLVNQ
ncbi:hypothetical protein EZS27_029251 [termite gut metagenome]|uniref:type II site-specific deoxyribonuclease n=1 Tax=termite gut metagenome TaxID=433724 RepID=A0A5J4QJ67_9ZZZZ